MRLHAVVHGYAEGVGFRYFVVDLARTRGLRRWVRNLDDGSVECQAEGPRQELDQLRRGPRGADVRHVEFDWQPARGDLPRGFEVTW